MIRLQEDRCHDCGRAVWAFLTGCFPMCGPCRLRANERARRKAQAQRWREIQGEVVAAQTNPETPGTAQT